MITDLLFDVSRVRRRFKKCGWLGSYALVKPIFLHNARRTLNSEVVAKPYFCFAADEFLYLQMSVSSNYVISEVREIFFLTLVLPFFS